MHFFGMTSEYINGAYSYYGYDVFAINTETRFAPKFAIFILFIIL